MYARVCSLLCCFSCLSLREASGSFLRALFRCLDEILLFLRPASYSYWCDDDDDEDDTAAGAVAGAGVGIKRSDTNNNKVVAIKVKEIKNVTQPSFSTLHVPSCADTRMWKIRSHGCFLCLSSTLYSSYSFLVAGNHLRSLTDDNAPTPEHLSRPGKLVLLALMWKVFLLSLSLFLSICSSPKRIFPLRPSGGSNERWVLRLQKVLNLGRKESKQHWVALFRRKCTNISYVKKDVKEMLKCGNRKHLVGVGDGRRFPT